MSATLTSKASVEADGRVGEPVGQPDAVD